MKKNLESNNSDKFSGLCSYLYWNGFQGKGRPEMYKYIFNSLNLEKYCEDPKMLSYFKDVDKNTTYLRQFKGDEEFCKYACNYILEVVKQQNKMKIRH